MRKVMYYLNLILNIFAIIIGLANLNNIKDELIFFPVVILIVFEFCLIIFKKKFISKIYDKRLCIFSIILVVLFSLMLPLVPTLNEINFNNNLILIKLIRLLFACSLLLSLFNLFRILLSYECLKNDDTKNTKKIVLWIIIILSLIFILSTTTGLYDKDFFFIWQYDVEYNKMSDWHSFGFVFLIHICKNFFYNPYFIVILNFILYIYYCNYALELIERQTRSKFHLVLFLFINLFTIVTFDQLRYVIKDVLFSLSFIIFILACFDYLSLGSCNKKIGFKIIVFSILSTLFRKNSVLFLLLMLMILFIVFLRKKQYKFFKYIFISIGMMLIIHFMFDYIGYNILKAQNTNKTDKNVAYTVPIYQVGAFANAGYSFSEDEIEYLEGYLPVEYMAKNFRKYDGDRLARYWHLGEHQNNINNFNYNALIPLNIKLFFDKPVFYIKSLLDLTNVIWKIEIQTPWSTYFENFMYTDDAHEWTELFDYVFVPTKTIFSNISDNIVKFGLYSTLTNIRIRGGFANFILLLSLMILIYKKCYKFILPMIFVFIWDISLLLSIATSTVRYVLLFINIYPFVLCFTLGIKKKIT